jgi:hypothetical protein
MYFYKPNNIITSILPRQEERSEAEESEWRGEWERVRRKREEEGHARRHRRAQARKSTRWMPRR